MEKTYLIFSFIFTFFWLILICLVYFDILSLKRVENFLKRFKKPLVTLVLLTLFVRLVPALILPRGAGADMGSFKILADLTLARHDIYTAPEALGRFNLLPFQIYFFALAEFFSRFEILSFIRLLKIEGILADIGLVILIFKGVEKITRNPNKALWVSLLFAFQPISLLLTSYHGQWDNLAAFLALLAWYLWYINRDLFKKVALAGFFLGLAILDKSWTVLLLPFFLANLKLVKERLLFLGTTFVAPLIFTFFYLWFASASLFNIFKFALGHSSVYGWWGYPVIIDFFALRLPTLNFLPPLLLNYGRYLTLALLLYLIFKNLKRKEILISISIVFVGFYAVTAGFGIQYLFWLVPFALLAGYLKELAYFTFFALIFYGISLFGYHLACLLCRPFSVEGAQILLKIFSLLPWGFSLFWLIAIFKRGYLWTKK